MSKRDGGSAFPLNPEVNFSHKGEVYPDASGMSVRDFFAAHIAAGMAAFSGTAGVSYGPDSIAGRSYEVADALIKAREA